MALSPRGVIQSVDLSRRVTFVVRLEGTDWTVAEVRRTLRGIEGLDLLEVRTDDEAEYLAIAGKPVAVGAAVAVLDVAPEERVRVLSRLRAEFGITLPARS